MKVALTGASGYTGSHLLKALLARGTAVRALVRMPSAWAPLRERGVEVVPGDLRDADAIARLVDGAQAVLHVAAVYRTAGHPDSYYRDVNVAGTERLLEAATRAGVNRFVHTSTVGVHGDVGTATVDESAPFGPGDIYQETKLEAEQSALTFHRTRGLPVCVVRPGAIYGPGETRLLKLFRAIARGRYAIVGSGRPHYHLVYIYDLVRGYLLALDRPEAAGEAFILAGARSVSPAELGAAIARAPGGRVLPLRIPAAPLQWLGSLCEAVCVPLGIEPPIHRRRVDFWTKHRSFSTEKARCLLDYEPLVDVEEGIARTVASYRQAGWL